MSLPPGGVLRVRRSAGLSEYKLHELIRNANRFGKAPPGKLLASRFVDDETEQYLLWLEIRLEDGPEGTDAPLQPVPVPDEVTRLHPTVAVLCKRGALAVSTSLRTRALRILHATAVEAERRGYEVGAGRPRAADESEETARATVHLVITVDGTKVPLALSEEQNRVEHLMTRPELAEQRRSPWTRFPSHDYVPSGRLRIDLAAGSPAACRWNLTRRAAIKVVLASTVESCDLLQHADRGTRLQPGRPD